MSCQPMRPGKLFRLTAALNFKGFIHSLNNYSLFYKKAGSLFFLVVVYVDDILLTGNNPMKLHDSKVLLDSEFKIKDIGDLSYFWGMEVFRESSWIILSQYKFVLVRNEKIKCHAKSSKVNLEQR